MFQGWVKGILLALPAIVLAAGAWAEVSAIGERVKSQQNEIYEMRAWLLRVEAKLDRVLEKR
jgi:hypothetical protein